LGWAEDSTPVYVRLAEVSGMVVAGLAGFGKTTLVAHLLGQLAPSPVVQWDGGHAGRGDPPAPRGLPGPADDPACAPRLMSNAAVVMDRLLDEEA
jgi:hypothetical protein